MFSLTKWFRNKYRKYKRRQAKKQAIKDLVHNIYNFELVNDDLIQINAQYPSSPEISDIYYSRTQTSISTPTPTPDGISKVC